MAEQLDPNQNLEHVSEMLGIYQQKLANETLAVTDLTASVTRLKRQLAEAEHRNGEHAAAAAEENARLTRELDAARAALPATQDDAPVDAQA